MASFSIPDHPEYCGQEARRCRFCHTDLIIPETDIQPGLHGSCGGWELCEQPLIYRDDLTGELLLGKSRQKFLFLPEEHNDFIFAIVCEELGFIGAGLILLLFMMLILRGYQIARQARDRFGALLVVGVISLFAMQTFLNVAVVTGLLPTTGISLPFFSYGGTALFLQLVEMGIVLSVSGQIGVSCPGNRSVLFRGVKIR